MSIVKPSTACTLECPVCLIETLHRRAWSASDWVCQECGTVSDKRPAIRITNGKQFIVVEPVDGGAIVNDIEVVPSPRPDDDSVEANPLPTYHELLDTLCEHFGIPGSPDFYGVMDWIDAHYTRIDK